MENLIKQFEKESGISATIESDLYADGEIYAKEYTEWLEKRIQALSMSGVEDSAVDFSRPLKQCMAGRDGECNHPNCPVSEKDVENGIYCQLPLIDWRE